MMGDASSETAAFGKVPAVDADLRLRQVPVANHKGRVDERRGGGGLQGDIERDGRCVAASDHKGALGPVEAAGFKAGQLYNPIQCNSKALLRVPIEYDQAVAAAEHCLA